METVYAIEEGEFSTFQVRGNRCELKIGSDVVRFELETTGDRLVALLDAFLRDQRQTRLDWLDSSVERHHLTLDDVSRPGLARI